MFSLLPNFLARHLDPEPFCPYFKNRQITYNLVDDAPAQAAYEIVKSWNEALKSSEIKVLGLGVFAQADASNMVKSRRAALARAKATVERELADGIDTLVPDWASGSLYLTRTGHDMLLGKWDRSTGWKWLGGLKAAFPLADLISLDLAMDMN
jgi:hypothetical protein